MNANQSAIFKRLNFGDCPSKRPQSAKRERKSFIQLNLYDHFFIFNFHYPHDGVFRGNVKPYDTKKSVFLEKVANPFDIGNSTFQGNAAAIHEKVVLVAGLTCDVEGKELAITAKFVGEHKTNLPRLISSLSVFAVRKFIGTSGRESGPDGLDCFFLFIVHGLYSREFRGNVKPYDTKKTILCVFL